MYIIVNDEKRIVASSKNKPSEEVCSAKKQRVFEIDDSEYSPSLIGQILDDFDIVEGG